MKILKYFSFLIVLLMTACHSTKNLVEGASVQGVAKVENAYKNKIVNNGQRAQCVTARMNLDLDAFGKSVSVGGQLRMKRDEVVQMSLSLLGFEVGRMEFTPSHVLIVDRVNKQYVRAAYHDVSFLQTANLDFYALQSLFWNELFIPGEREVKSHLDRFRYNDEGSHVLLSLEDTPKLKYQFLTQSDPGILSRVSVAGKGSEDRGQLEWTYDGFVELDGRLFPSVMSCKVKGLDKNIGLSLQLNRLNNNDSWSTETKISSRYTERKVEEILERLVTM